MHPRGRLELLGRARLALGRQLLSSYSAACRAARRAAHSAPEGAELRAGRSELGAGEAEASPRAVFVNQELDVSSLKWIGTCSMSRLVLPVLNASSQGMDYDYTLAGYTRHLPSTIYDLAKEHLVSLARPAGGSLVVASRAFTRWRLSALSLSSLLTPRSPLLRSPSSDKCQAVPGVAGDAPVRPFLRGAGRGLRHPAWQLDEIGLPSQLRTWKCFLRPPAAVGG
jgi:hypothetical protein